jgi:uncharacterized BrkB/YihY/UPF0761 family membrane protein
MTPLPWQCRFSGNVGRRKVRLPAMQRVTPTPRIDIYRAPGPRRFWRDRTLRRWVVAWVGAAGVGIVNGALRELAYKDRVGDSKANRISVATLVALLALYFSVLQRRSPLATKRDALSIGAIWVVLTVLFEFGFGHYVDGDSWEELFANYDMTEGNLWVLVLLWIGAGPATVRALGAERSA